MLKHSRKGVNTLQIMLQDVPTSLVEGLRRYDAFLLFHFNDDCRNMSHGLSADGRFFRTRGMCSLSLVQAALGDVESCAISIFITHIFFSSITTSLIPFPPHIQYMSYPKTEKFLSGLFCIATTLGDANYLMKSVAHVAVMWFNVNFSPRSS